MSAQPEQSTLFSAVSATIPNEQSALAFFVKIRWQEGEFCPYCDHDKLYRLRDDETHKCANCKMNFSVKVGTIFEGTKLPIRTWYLAIAYLLDNAGKVSSTALAQRLGVTQKRAWLMLQRLHAAASTPSFKRPLPKEGKGLPPATRNANPELPLQPLEKRPKRPPRNYPIPLVLSQTDPNETQIVEDALHNLTFNSINLSTGLDHPGDEKRARHTLGKLVARGIILNPAGIFHWAKRNQWDRHSARQLEAVARECNEMEMKKRVVEGTAPWKDQLEQQIATRTMERPDLEDPDPKGATTQFDNETRSSTQRARAAQDNDDIDHAMQHATSTPQELSLSQLYRRALRSAPARPLSPRWRGTRNRT